MARILMIVTLAVLTVAWGTTISSAQTPPAIVGQPLSQQVIAGSNAVFSVAATGDNPVFQWYFNDTNAIPGALSSTLVLTNIQSAQAGNYSVSVSNAGGSVTSTDAALTVLTETIIPFPLGTLGYDLYAGTCEKAGQTNSRTASYNPAASNLGTNTAVWTWPINLSCVGYASDGFQSVLIASNELLTCAHFGGETGQTVTFHDTNGLPWVAIVTNTINPIADLMIAQLSNAAPASIVLPFVLPPDYTNYLAGQTLLGMPAFWLHKNTGHIDYAPISALGDYLWYGYGTWVQLHHTNDGFGGSLATDGDSGSPGFLSWHNCPVLIFATSLSADASGLFVSGLTNWNSLAALGLTNGMKVLDLSGYSLLPGNGPSPAGLQTNHVNPFSFASLLVAGFTATPISGPAPLQVRFSGASNSRITNWLWNFGDGISLANNAANATHTYAAAGNYSVTLTVSGPGGASTLAQTNFVTVFPPAAPVAGFAGTPASGYVPLPVVFSDASSGPITNWVWSFGDGNSLTNDTAGSLTNTYAAVGSYPVTLTVSGPGGASTSTQTNYVIVSPVSGGQLSTLTGTQTGGIGQFQAMTGGATPNITLNTPATQLNVSADSVFTFTWQTTDPNPGATINLYVDANNNPASGLIPVVTGLPNTTTSYVWQASATLAGTNYYAYATLTDGTVATSFAPGRLQIDPVGAFRLLSSIVATNAAYVWLYSYYGTNYTGTNQLVLGANVISVTNGAAIHQFIVTREASLAQVEAVQYNPLNQVATTTNGNGIVTTLTYDPLGRLVQRSSSNGALVTYGYDVLGNRTNMMDYTGTTFYQYDALSRLTNVVTSVSGVLGAGDNLSLSYQYDLAGHETAIIYPGGETIQYGYDHAGRLSAVTNATHTLVFQYTYNPTNGQLLKLTRPNGIETDYAYDGMGRLTNILHQFTTGQVLVAQYGYTLDAIGKATLLTTTLPGGVLKYEQYGYDYFDRLTNVIYADSGILNDPNALNVSYTYDGNGNRLTMTTRTNNAVTEIRSYAYGAENRLLTVNNQNGLLLNAYAYDPAGNRIQKIATNNTAFYAYDERNLLTSYGDLTNLIAYTYNGDAQRLSESVNGAGTNYIIDANRSLYEVVQERNATGAITTSYTFGAARLATWNGSTVTFELTDRLGSVRLVTDAGGNVLQSYYYDVFGAIR